MNEYFSKETEAKYSNLFPKEGMKRRVFEGETFDFMTMPTWTVGGMGTTFMFRENLKDGPWIYGDPGAKTNFWIKDIDDDFQNSENIYNALGYIDVMPDSEYKNAVMEILSSMKGNTGGEEFCRKIGFMCELGCWEDPKLRQEQLYDSDFSKYVMNCMNQYGLIYK